MRIISDEELAGLPTRGRGGSGKIFNAIISLETGQNLLIEKSEWKKLYPPTQKVTYIQKRYKRKYRCRTLANGQGWVISRVS